MNRRTSFKTMATAAIAAAGTSASAAGAGKGIQLHVDLNQIEDVKKMILFYMSNTQKIKKEFGLESMKMGNI